MRIISGTARGTKLYTLDSLETRPTLDRVKESIFNILQQDIKDSIFLDLFSGSGAMGLEAASRGAKKVILCDNSKQATEIINKNISKTHLENKVYLYNLDFEKTLYKIKENDEKLDIIYLDPPYKSDYAIKSLELLNKLELITNNTKIIIETDEEEKIITKLKENSFKIKDRRKYGRAIILFLEYDEK
jgi:16S rRNA (guanine(966)-N(2))-methyltransferase RsmD